MCEAAYIKAFARIETLRVSPNQGKYTYDFVAI